MATSSLHFTGLCQFVPSHVPLSGCRRWSSGQASSLGCPSYTAEIPSHVNGSSARVPTRCSIPIETKLTEAFLPNPQSCRNAACPANDVHPIPHPPPFHYIVALFAWYSWFSFSRISVNLFFLSASRYSLVCQFHFGHSH